MVRDEVESLGESFLSSAPLDHFSFLQSLEAIIPNQSDLTLEHVAAKPADIILEEVHEIVERKYEEIEETNGAELQRLAERLVLVKTIDSLWMSHLTAMDEMRQGIGLRAYGQTDPLVAYKREAHDMYEQLSERIRQTVSRNIFHTQLQTTEVSQLLNTHKPQTIKTSGPVEPGTETIPMTPANPVTEGTEVDSNASRAERRRAIRAKKKTKKRNNHQR